MAYDFVAPGAAIGKAFEDLMAQRELERQRAVAEKKAAEEMALKQAADKRAAAQAEDQRKAAELSRQTSEEALRQSKVKATEADLAQAGKGSKITDDLATRAKALTPFLMDETPGEMKTTLPASTINMDTGARTALPQEEYQAPGELTYKGTVAERQQDALAKAIGGAKTRREAIAAALDNGVPAAQVDDVVNTLFKGAKTLLYRTKTGALAYDAEGKNPYTSQTLPEDYQIVNDPTAGAGGGGGAPFLMAIPTAAGTQLVNGRDISQAGKTFSLRPSAAQQQDMANNAAALTQIELIKQDFNPEWVGPAAGRYNSVVTAFTNNKDNAGLVRMQTRVASLKNRFVKAITGAQMSEPEARRIMSEMPDMNLPPTTFWERMSVAEENLNNLMEIQQQVYTGMRAPAANAVTEAQLNKLFPDSMYTGGAAPKTGVKSATPAKPGAAPSAPAPTKSKYKVTVS